MRRLYLGFWMIRIRRWWMRKHKTRVSIGIGLIISIISVALGFYGWTANTTVDNLKIEYICPQSTDIAGSTFDMIIDFENQGLPVQISWTIDAITNISSIDGSLSSTIPNGFSVQHMVIVVQGSFLNSTVYQTYSLAKYSAFPEPRVFSQSLPEFYTLRSYRLLDDVGQFLPPVIAFLFYTQEGNRPAEVCL